MKKVWNWFRDYWYLPVIAAGAIALWLLTGTKRKSPGEALRRELAAIDAGKQARAEAEEKGAAAATTLVKAKYKEKMEALDDKRKKKVKNLESDPAALARYLERASRG